FVGVGRSFFMEAEIIERDVCPMVIADISNLGHRSGLFINQPDIDFLSLLATQINHYRPERHMCRVISIIFIDMARYGEKDRIGSGIHQLYAESGQGTARYVER